MSKASEQVKSVLKILDGRYPLVPGLHYHNAWELLLAVMLSAQTTDQLVNKVTPVLFLNYPSPQEMALAKETDIANMIRSINYYKTKARHLLQTALMLCDQHKGQVPHTMEELLCLPGVARKTANVVLTHAFSILEGIVVDTHVIRLSGRLGLSKEKQRDRIEQDLMKITSKKHWGDLATLLVYHGRKVCKAQKPLCSECLLNALCPKIGLN
jgi:endonuclease III